MSGGYTQQLFVNTDYIMHFLCRQRQTNRQRDGTNPL